MIGDFSGSLNGHNARLGYRAGAGGGGCEATHLWRNDETSKKRERRMTTLIWRHRPAEQTELLNKHVMGEVVKSITDE